MTVCFFGHRDAPERIAPVLERVLIELIEKENADTFYIGNNGNFDTLAHLTLVKLLTRFPSIHCFTVLAYLPHEKAKNFPTATAFATLYPEGLENVPPRFAICGRNRWMLENSNILVTYVTHTFGGAAHFKAQGARQGKRIVELSCLFPSLS